jgi:hypothetical protein
MRAGIPGGGHGFTKMNKPLPSILLKDEIIEIYAIREKTLNAHGAAILELQDQVIANALVVRDIRPVC